MTSHSREHLRGHRMERFALFLFGGTGLVIVAVLALGWIVQLLWNATIAPSFDVGMISFWQAIGLFLLAKLFFGFGGGINHTRSGRWGKSRKGAKRAPEGAAVAEGSTDDSDVVSDVPTTEAFRDYWESEGKSAYETFLADQDGRADSRQEQPAGSDRD